jgi:hypothetical protein
VQLTLYFWCPFGVLLVSFWCPFGVLLVSFWCPFGAVFGKKLTMVWTTNFFSEQPCVLELNIAHTVPVIDASLTLTAWERKIDNVHFLSALFVARTMRA